MNIFLMLKNEGTQHTASAWIGETVFHSENEGEIHEEEKWTFVFLLPVQEKSIFEKFELNCKERVRTFFDNFC